MTSLVRFAPELAEWVSTHLDRGATPAALVDVLQERVGGRDSALALVGASVRARRERTLAPLETAAARAPSCRAESPRWPGRPSIATSDRIVRVAATAERPLLAVLNDVLDSSECEALIELARGRLQPSRIVDPASGSDVVAATRTSFGMFFRPAENDLVARIDRRFAEIMGLPVDHGEALQVLYYPQGAGSAPHFDFLVASNAANSASIARSGQRVATLVAYLNDVSQGGETIFPAAGWAVSPQRGHAVGLKYADAAGEVDLASLHASAIVTVGEKWVATKWLRARPFVSA
jgi:prolyl 4-hydroxylase